MIEPKEYYVPDGVTEREFISAGFRSYTDHYTINKYLYKDLIRLNILIDKSDGYIVINVTNENSDTYVPFYNPETRHDNLVYEEVVKNFNKFMDSLVKKKVLKVKRKRKRKVKEKTTMETPIHIKVLNERAKIPTRGSK